MTIMDGKIVYADAEFVKRNPPLPPAMPDWSPVNNFGGYYSDATQQTGATLRAQARTGCGCASACALHGHDHGIAWNSPIPIADNMKKAFWGALGCSCFAV